MFISTVPRIPSVESCGTCLTRPGIVFHIVLIFRETTLKLTYLFFSHEFTKYCYSYARVIWSFSGWVPFWAYKYLPINLSSPTPNQKYVSKCENRSSLKFIELLYQKIAVYPPKKTYYHNNLIIFHNFKVHLLLKQSYSYDSEWI